MDEGHEPKAVRLLHNHLAELGKGEAIDNRTGVFGKHGQCRSARVRISHRQFDDPDQTPACSQALDNLPLEQISAGKLIKPARDDKGNLIPHSSGAS
jgi:hypothetical protein